MDNCMERKMAQLESMNKLYFMFVIAIGIFIIYTIVVQQGDRHRVEISKYCLFSNINIFKASL